MSHTPLRLFSLGLLAVLLAGCQIPGPSGTLPTAVIPATSTVAASPTTVPATATTAATATATPTFTAGSPIPVYGYRVVATYPHDPQAFTEGLVLIGDTLYEGTGLYGETEVRRVDLATGEIRQARANAANEFGEGITVIDNRIIQLTWTNGLGYVYDLESFEPQRTFNYPGEGWGLTHDGSQLIMSDGTAFLRFLDPNSFQELRRVEVRDENGPVVDINELEYIDGLVYANIWHSDRIARIDPATGLITAWIDLTGIDAGERPADSEAVANGIAYDAANDRLVVTGKYWPKVYEIRLIDSSGNEISLR